MIYVILRFCLHTQGMRKAMMKKTGPNDARHVVWAKGTFFFSFFFHAFIILTNVFTLYML